MIVDDYLYLAHRLDRAMAGRFCPQLRGLVIDVGCGRKPYRELLPGDCRYYGMDYGADRSPDVVGSVLALPFRSACADAVMCNEVLEHVPRPADALKEIRRILKPGGQLYITVPQCWGLHYEPHDYFRYTKYGLRYLLEQGGFEVSELHRMGGLFSFIAVRLIDFIVMDFFFKVFAFLGIERGKYRISALLVLPLNLVLAPLVGWLDLLDATNVYGWAALARKAD